MKTVFKIFGIIAVAPTIFVLLCCLAFAACGGDDSGGAESSASGNSSSAPPNLGAGTDGLAYELIDDGTAYRVREGTVTEGEVTIPAYYRPDEESEYLPVTEVGMIGDLVNGAFYNTAVTEVIFLEPSNITTLGGHAFFNAKGLTSVTLPAGVTALGFNVFRQCSGLKNVTVLAVTPPTLPNSGVFSGAHADVQFFVPPGSVAAYQAAERWSAYAGRIQAIP